MLKVDFGLYVKLLLHVVCRIGFAEDGFGSEQMSFVPGGGTDVAADVAPELELCIIGDDLVFGVNDCFLSADSFGCDVLDLP